MVWTVQPKAMQWVNYATKYIIVKYITSFAPNVVKLPKNTLEFGGSVKQAALWFEEGKSVKPPDVIVPATLDIASLT